MMQQIRRRWFWIAKKPTAGAKRDAELGDIKVKREFYKIQMSMSECNGVLQASAYILRQKLYK